MKSTRPPEPSAATNKRLVWLPRAMAAACAAIIAIIPLHPFLSVWISSFRLDYTAVRLWKEAVLGGLLLGGIVLLLVRPNLRRAFAGDKPIRLMLVYGLLLVLAGLYAILDGTVTPKAFLYGLLLDGRFLAFFAVCWLAAQQSELLIRFWRQLLLIPATIVVLLGTLQYTLLPADFLRHFGYGSGTIPASITIDQKDAYQRIQSTLRGPNPLGAYLVIVLSALGAVLVGFRRVAADKARFIVLALFYVLSLGALLFSFSRSAWLGAVAATAFLLVTSVLLSRRARRTFLLVSLTGIMAFGGTLYALRDNDRFQNIFFHTDESSRSAESSNTGHLSAVTDGAREVAANPLGSGTGTAGPASVYNEAAGQDVRIAENYYIQVAQETGLVGLGLFVAINLLVARRLWARRQELLPRILLASFIGLTVVNMFSHAWADDTLAYLWWGLAGAAIAARAGHPGHLEESD